MASLLITPFMFENHQLRTFVKNGIPWFVAQDICDALQITNSRKAIAALDDDEKDVTLSYTLGGKQRINIINESGMYTLVLRCRDAVKQGTLPHRFRKWVTNEVLPSIRKTGSYQTSKRVASTATLVTCPCCKKPAGIITIHKTHREQIGRAHV